MSATDPFHAEMSAMLDYEFMAGQEQANSFLMSMFIRAERGSEFANQLAGLLAGNLVVSQEVANTYNVGAIAAEANRHLLDSLDPNDDEDTAEEDRDDRFERARR